MRFIGHFKDFIKGFKGDKQIIFTVDNYVDKSVINALDSEKQYSIEVKEVKSKRSLQQNAYFWLLVHEINLAMNDRPIDDEDVYCMLLEKANVKFIFVGALEVTEKELYKSFRVVKKIKSIDLNGVNGYMYKCYLGSSEFDTKEMSILIEKALDVASELNLDIAYWNEVFE